jgi:hypothetical protein
MTSLAERLDSFPEAWRPTNAGEKLIGELTDVDLRESDYGDPYTVLTVLAEDGSTQDGEMIPPGTELAWHAFHTMARNAVKRKQPQVGERVGIVYAGVGEAQPGMNAPVRWRLLVERPKPERFDYDTVPAGADDQPEATSEPERDADIPF